MNNLNYLLVGLFTLMLAFTSCKDAGVKKVTNADSKGLKVNMPKGPLTTAEPYGESTFNYGTVNEGEVVDYVFKIKNTGNEPLVIKSAKSTCGCTVPKKPEHPIAPGEVADISVKFNTTGKGKRDGGVQKNTKVVTVTANTSEPIKFTLTGLVERSAKQAAEAREKAAKAKAAREKAKAIQQQGPVIQNK